jgi:spermidine/putrescine transport system substrate-binding protein
MTYDNEDLAFYYPKEGVNYFVDAMCIPKSSKNPEVAKEYINFMLSEEVAVANAIYIGYASPNTLVSENEDYLDEMGEFAIDLLYGKMPSEVNKAYNELIGDENASCYRSFDPSIQARVNRLWENLKLANSTEVWIHVTTVIIVVLAVGLGIYTTYVKKKRSRDYRLRDKAARKSKIK